uniref:Uncharacterized protein n=1 Tax=Anguilla anguilla TaxID=7936 RepID=A0A0E9T2Z7_ANGAN
MYVFQLLMLTCILTCHILTRKSCIFG